MPEAREAQAQAVVFDIGRVLFDWNLRYLFEKLIEDQAELDWFLANVVTESWHFQSDGGRPLSEMLPERIAEFPQHAPLIEAYAERFMETLPHAVPGTHELVRRLAERNVPLYALTNFGAEFWTRFRPMQPVFDPFLDVVVSGEECCVKPDPKIYEIAEARFGFPPEALFFTDDNAANVAAARARGWQAHLFTDAASLETALIERGLLL
ncbi:HAD-IA family hydrolase [Croceibacterium sp. LX-88]|uniref:HAD-IA family hydrolase n=1 Tax=Croceibacterium selenioxidans TaxID=2838833 RepID=A0ABS5W7E2_9SPHN|nr:HAD-IA family hydrolase [Croceibacterium selenioxidans]MBT2135666.1 HAD-IA family hydrolase [Croceibacterium selenioxidans]